MFRGPLYRSRWQAPLLLGLLCLMRIPAVLACGYCIEDKIASVYDHASVSRALSQKHLVVFFVLEGRLSATSTEKNSLENIANSVPGVDLGSAKVSVETASLAVSINTALKPFASVESSLQKKLLLRGLSLQLLRVMDKPAEFLSLPASPVIK